MGKVNDIIFLIILLVGLLVAFPEYIQKVLANKMYTVLSGLVIVMIIFFIWLKTQKY